MEEFIVALVLISIIAFMLLIEKRRIRSDDKKDRNDREKRWKERRDAISMLTDDEIKSITLKTEENKKNLISAIENDYEIREYHFPPFKAEKGIGLRNESLSYLKIEDGCDRIAAFFFNSFPDIRKLCSITLNLNGMVSRRFEGYEEYLQLREFDIKTGDLITLEIEFDSSESFELTDISILLLKRKN